MSENDSETPTGQPDGGLAEDVIVLPRGPQAEVVTLESGAFSGVQATVEQKRESVRAWIALMLLAIFGLTVIAALLAVIFSDANCAPPSKRRSKISRASCRLFIFR